MLEANSVRQDHFLYTTVKYAYSGIASISVYLSGIIHCRLYSDWPCVGICEMY